MAVEESKGDAPDGGEADIRDMSAGSGESIPKNSNRSEQQIIEENSMGVAQSAPKQSKLIETDKKGPSKE